MAMAEDSESSSFDASRPAGVSSSGGIGLPDPAIRLFGKMILLPPVPLASSVARPGRAEGVEGQNDTEFESDVNPLSPSGVEEVGISSGCGSGSEEDDAHVKSSGEKPKNEAIPDEDDMDEGKPYAASRQDAAPPRPDKPVPCPRCDSMDTKFCYFNNYNVNQLRYFCRNCQRYWTAGGTLRNVPVGAGRRKNKHSTQRRQSHEGTVVVRRDNPGGAEPPLSCSCRPGESKASSNPAQSTSELCTPSVENGCLCNTSPSSYSFSFARGGEVPMTGENLTSFSMPGVQTTTTRPFPVQRSRAASGVDSDIVYGSPPKIPNVYGTRSSEISNITEATTGRKGGSTSSTARASASETGSDANFEGDTSFAIPPPAADSEGGCNRVAFPVSGMPWPYMCMNWAGGPAPAPTSGPPLWANSAATTSPSVPVWCGPPAGFWPWPSLSGAMWSPQGWTVPWALPWNAATVTAAAVAAPTGLAKRPREPLKGAGDGSLCIPKTLRIRDPDEAACSSILSTLGVDTNSGPLISSGTFNAFKPKAEIFQRKKVESNNLPQDDRHTNPAAAMARSIAFQESR